MFCGECGTKNEQSSLFCENCGSKLKTEVVVKNESSEKKKISKKTIAILAVVVVLFGSYFFLNDLFSPKTIAKNYFNALVNLDTDKVYNYLEVETNEFVTKKKFQEFMKEKMAADSKIKLENYTVNDAVISTDKLNATVKINFLLKNEKDTSNVEISLVKAKKKKLFIFDNWKVVEKSMSVSDFKFNVPKGSTLAINGKEVKSKYLDKNISNDNLDIYVISNLLPTEYNVKIKIPMGIEVEDKVDISSYKREYTASINEDNLTDEIKNKIKTSTTEDLQTLYDSAKDKKTWEEVKSNFEYKKGKLDDLKTAYENLVSALTTSTRILTNITFTDVEINSINFNDNGGLLVSVKANYNFSVSYTSGSETKTNESTDSDSMYLTYEYVDSDFKLVNATSLNTYFSIYF